MWSKNYLVSLKNKVKDDNPCEPEEIPVQSHRWDCPQDNSPELAFEQVGEEELHYQENDSFWPEPKQVEKEERPTVKPSADLKKGAKNRGWFGYKDGDLTVTSSGTLIVSAEAAIRLIIENGTLESMRKHMQQLEDNSEQKYPNVKLVADSKNKFLRKKPRL